MIKHIAYFDNRVLKDKNLQYFSVVEKKATAILMN